MTVIRDTIDLGAAPEERYRHLRRIVENVLGDTDPGDTNAARRRWLTWILLYLMWHEGDAARTRTQQGGGPGRGLMQFEPRTLHWLITQYILGPTAGLVANLAAAAGVSADEMREALRRFKDSADPGNNVWPNPVNDDPAKKLERWLLDIDSFGIKLMRYVFRAYGNEHSFPPQAEADRTADPQEERFKPEHSGHWGRWWKRSFPSDEERERILRLFEEHARQLDETARRAAAQPPPPAPAPAPQPTPTPPAPGSGGGQCPFMLALADRPMDVLALRQIRTDLAGSPSGDRALAMYESLRPGLVRAVMASSVALLGWTFVARVAGRCARLRAAHAPS